MASISFLSAVETAEKAIKRMETRYNDDGYSMQAAVCRLSLPLAQTLMAALRQTQARVAKLAEAASLREEKHREALTAMADHRAAAESAALEEVARLCAECMYWKAKTDQCGEVMAWRLEKITELEQEMAVTEPELESDPQMLSYEQLQWRIVELRAEIKDLRSQLVST